MGDFLDGNNCCHKSFSTIELHEDDTIASSKIKQSLKNHAPQGITSENLRHPSGCSKKKSLLILSFLRLK